MLISRPYLDLHVVHRSHESPIGRAYSSETIRARTRSGYDSFWQNVASILTALQHPKCADGVFTAFHFGMATKLNARCIGCTQCTCDDCQSTFVCHVHIIWNEQARPSCCFHTWMSQTLYVTLYGVGSCQRRKQWNVLRPFKALRAKMVYIAKTIDMLYDRTLQKTDINH